MITSLRIKGFKSWADTGELKLAPLTGLFGTNSSGKTSILQALLVLKQTAESPDRTRVLHTGDKKTSVDLGTYYDVVHKHETGTTPVNISAKWVLPEPLKIRDPQKKAGTTLFDVKQLAFDVEVLDRGGPVVRGFAYSLSGGERFGMELKQGNGPGTKREYKLISDGYDAKRTQGRPWPLPDPAKCYGFPDEAVGYYQNMGFLPTFPLAFEDMCASMAYLGPLREYPERSYLWAGEKPVDVGARGDRAIPALLASNTEGPTISRGAPKSRQTVEERIADWLKKLGLIHSFSLKQIGKGRRDYEVRVKRSASSAEVLITDVGFGVSQILPVLVLCYYVPEKSVILLEQPEIHLHPAVQAGLADVLIDAVKTRNLQIVVESHSEHLLRRLQRRIAEEEIAASDTALYFCRSENGASQADKLDVDLLGNIRNWPEGFFGDEMGELAAMTKAAMQRKAAE